MQHQRWKTPPRDSHSRTLSGLFFVGVLNRPRKRKRTNRENPRTIPDQIGKIPEKSGKDKKGQKRTKKEGQVQIGKHPRLKHPRLATCSDSIAKLLRGCWHGISRYVAKWCIALMRLCETKYQGGGIAPFWRVLSSLKYRAIGEESKSIPFWGS